LGFIFGPALGGLGLKLGGVTAPGWIAAAMCGLNFLFAFARLPESWQPGANAVAQRPRWEQVKLTLQRPGIGLLVLVFFLATFSFACFETTLGLLVSLNFGLKFESIKGVVHTFDDKVMYLYTFCGLVGALVQGGPLGRAVKKFGEPTLIALSLLLVALSLGVLPFVKTWPLLIGALAMLAIGSSLTRPPVFGMLSQLAPADEQGATLGVAQSAGSLARIFGPIFAATLFDGHPSWPYLACAGVSLVAGLLAWAKLSAVRMPAQ
jgi:DHA1 family tetracycline resistance protein-like MFS transporter